ncbi:MAG TPA: c-type cytochrome [Candidatus Acidoferrum sp.]|jgi:putative heme-binding domain-containing protein
MTRCQRLRFLFTTRRTRKGAPGDVPWLFAFERLALVTIAIVLATLAFTVKGTPAAQDNPSQTERPIAEARQTFENRCAACHGLDGRGGERAPDIATSQKTQNRTDAALTQIITNGIPTSGMPSFSSLDAPTIRALVKYLRILQGKSESAAMPGNPANGKTIFFGSKAQCSQCHLAAGSGGFLGPDLSTFARRRPADEIRDAIIKPTTMPGLGRSEVTVTPRNGMPLVGVLRNEDNFSLQLQSFDGAFHSVSKSDSVSVSRSSKPLMPTDYSSTLTTAELNDVISFLMSTAQQNNAAGDKLNTEPQDESE